MDPRTELQEKLAYLNSKLSESPESQTAEERQKHLDMLRDVMNTMASMEKDLKKAVNESNPDACTLRVIGSFPRAADGGVLYPPRKDIQENLNRIFREYIRYEICIEVQAKFVEINFNNIRHYPVSCFLEQQEELYVKVGSPEQMDCILRFSDKVRHLGFELIKPPQKSAAREAYRAIGNLLLRLRTVDQKCKELGAISIDGTPKLPENMVQTEQFDDTVKALEDNISEIQSKLRNDPTSMKHALHIYLCRNTRVDKRKRQASLDPLLDERIDILKKLSRFNPDDYPFAYDREFK
jgi:hypothetical protein